MGSGNRQIPVTDEKGMSLMNRTVAALRVRATFKPFVFNALHWQQCFDSRAAGMIMKFESHLLSQARATTLSMDFDEFIGDVRQDNLRLLFLCSQCALLVSYLARFTMCRRMHR